MSLFCSKRLWSVKKSQNVRIHIIFIVFKKFVFYSQNMFAIKRQKGLKPDRLLKKFIALNSEKKSVEKMHSEKKEMSILRV